MAFDSSSILDILADVCEDAGISANNIIKHRPYRQEDVFNVPSAAIYIEGGTTIERSNMGTDAQAPVRRKNKYFRVVNIAIEFRCYLEDTTLKLHRLISQFYRQLEDVSFTSGDNTPVIIGDVSDYAREVRVSNITESYPLLIEVNERQTKPRPIS